MNKKLMRHHQRQINQSHNLLDQRCRKLIKELKSLPKPLRYDAICQHQLRGPGGAWFGGAKHIVEAEMLLQGIVSACIFFGWLEETSRKRPDSFNLSDEFALKLAAHKVKKNVEKKQPSMGGPVIITIEEKVNGLHVKCGGEESILKKNQRFLLLTLQLKKDAVVSFVDLKMKNKELFCNLARHLRSKLSKDLCLEPSVFMNGIRMEYGQGYILDTSILNIRVVEQASRQRGVASYKVN